MFDIESKGKGITISGKPSNLEVHEKKLEKFIPRWLVHMTSDEHHYVSYKRAIDYAVSRIKLMVLLPP